MRIRNLGPHGVARTQEYRKHQQTCDRPPRDPRPGAWQPVVKPRVAPKPIRRPSVVSLYADGWTILEAVPEKHTSPYFEVMRPGMTLLVAFRHALQRLSIPSVSSMYVPSGSVMNAIATSSTSISV